MRTSDSERLESIANALLVEMENPTYHAGLMSGKTGFALFLANMYLATRKEKYINPVYEFVQNTMENPKALVQGSFFCNGFSGFVWFLKFLESNGLMDGHVDEIIGYQLMSDLYEDTRDSFAGNWDFLHGSIGIAHVFKDKPEFRKLIVEKLKTNVVSKSDGSKYWVQNMSKGNLNFGFAHGVPSILKYLSSHFNGVEEEKELIEGCFLSLDSARLPEGSKSIFPNNEATKTWSRLAWCYGDLSIAYAMTAYDSKYDEGIEIALSCAKRKNFEDTSVFDAGFCHGSAGLTQLFRKINKKYSNPELDLAANFWLEKTKKFLWDQENEFWDPEEARWKNDYSLINGLSGAGLVLLNQDTGWEDCFMLS